MTPLRNNVFVHVPTVAEEKTDGGIILTTTSRPSGSLKGTVTAVGVDVTEVTVGDLVLIDSQARKITFEPSGEKQIIVEEDSILATVIL